MLPDLLREFRAKGWQFSSIRVAVQVRIPAEAREKTARPPLDEKARAAIAREAERLEDSPLKEALLRLARRRD